MQSICEDCLVMLCSVHINEIEREHNEICSTKRVNI